MAATMLDGNVGAKRGASSINCCADLRHRGRKEKGKRRGVGGDAAAMTNPVKKVRSAVTSKLDPTAGEESESLSETRPRPAEHPETLGETARGEEHEVSPILRLSNTSVFVVHKSFTSSSID
ncbi:unnamed protein product [Soboliphyme baturini]|uniref:Uncharacterized protein n=1 Tax=Soboliphyme baturini TaxID=241478 RepID=A0A183IVD1_9BILA|nr:unnamed protein product [Soboliphyme baturini]